MGGKSYDGTRTSAQSKPTPSREGGTGGNGYPDSFVLYWESERVSTTNLTAGGEPRIIAQ